MVEGFEYLNYVSLTKNSPSDIVYNTFSRQRIKAVLSRVFCQFNLKIKLAHKIQNVQSTVCIIQQYRDQPPEPAVNLKTTSQDNAVPSRGPLV